MTCIFNTKFAGRNLLVSSLRAAKFLVDHPPDLTGVISLISRVATGSAQHNLLPEERRGEEKGGLSEGKP